MPYSHEESVIISPRYIMSWEDRKIKKTEPLRPRLFLYKSNNNNNKNWKWITNLYAVVFQINLLSLHHRELLSSLFFFLFVDYTKENSETYS